MNLVEYFLSKVVVCSWSKDMETLPGRYLLLSLFNKFTIPNYSESKIVKFPGRLCCTMMRFCPYTGKYGSEKNHILTYFTQCVRGFSRIAFICSFLIV